VAPPGRPATEASDRYALAVAAYELLVGERPFAASHFAAQARQHVEEPPPAASARNPALPVAVDAVLERGMAKEPGKRWPSAGAFAQALESALAKPSPAPSGLAATIPLPGRAATPEITRHRVPNRRWRSLAVGALAAAALGIGIAAGAHDTSSAPKRAAGTMGTGSHHRAARTGDARRAPTAASTAPTLPGKDAAALEVQGHGLMLAGNYRAALPILRRAVAAADHSGLTYAYALFDLGHSLRLAGDPQAAIPILRKRLQIPNQTATVQAELQAALQAAGRTAPASTTPAPARPASPSSRKNGHGKHKGVGGD
jgi:serine/threonine-protein kinase